MTALGAKWQRYLRHRGEVEKWKAKQERVDARRAEADAADPDRSVGAKLAEFAATRRAQRPGGSFRLADDRVSLPSAKRSEGRGMLAWSARQRSE